MYNNFVVQDSMRSHRTYKGNSEKFGIVVDGTKYLVKIPVTHGRSVSPYTEYIASNFIRELGINCQEVWLGIYGSHRVSIIKDFVAEGWFLREFDDIHQSSVDTDLTSKAYTYEDVTHVLEKHFRMESSVKAAMLEQFWKMFVCDAILGNRDRHGGNWGYLATSNARKPAPIYDNGSSLFPGVGGVIQNFINHEFSFLSERSEKFPASLFQMQREDGINRRTNYYEMLGKCAEFPEMRAAMASLDFASVYGAITKTVMSARSIIPKTFQRFYVEIVCMRYLHMVERLSLEDAYNTIKGRVYYEHFYSADRSY